MPDDCLFCRIVGGEIPSTRSTRTTSCSRSGTSTRRRRPTSSCSRPHVASAADLTARTARSSGGCSRSRRPRPTGRPRRRLAARDQRRRRRRPDRGPPPRPSPRRPADDLAARMTTAPAHAATTDGGGTAARLRPHRHRRPRLACLLVLSALGRRQSLRRRPRRRRPTGARPPNAPGRGRRRRSRRRGSRSRAAEPVPARRDPGAAPRPEAPRPDLLPDGPRGRLCRHLRAAVQQRRRARRQRPRAYVGSGTGAVQYPRDTQFSSGAWARRSCSSLVAPGAAGPAHAGPGRRGGHASASRSPGYAPPMSPDVPRHDPADRQDRVRHRGARGGHHGARRLASGRRCR